MRKIIQISLTLGILAIGILVFNSTKGCEKKIFSKDGSTAKKKTGKRAYSGKAMRIPKIRTKAIPLEKKNYMVVVESQGEVRAHHNTALTPQVGGRVVHLSDKFEDGAFFNKGDVLLKIDNADYLTEIETARAQLARAEAAHAQEKARAKQALLNWKDAGFDEEPSDLVLRKPQLREAEATVNSAHASVERAERNLIRTEVIAPYNGRVRVRNVGLGQQVGPGTTLGEIYATDVAEVRLPLSSRDLKYYQPPHRISESSKPTGVLFSSLITHGSKKPTWIGWVIRTEGVLDEQSRQLYIITRIEDPFGLKPDSKGTPLFIGQPLRGKIIATTLKDVYVIPRKGLSDVNKIILVRDGKIKHLEIDPVWSTEDKVVIDKGIEPGDQLNITRLPFAPEGAPVEIITEEDEKNASPKNTPSHGHSHHGHGH